jgi:cytosine deaminase
VDTEGAYLCVKEARLLDGSVVDLRVRDGKIAALGPKLEPAQEERIVGAGGGLCVRPFTDSHLHLDKAGSAALAEGVSSISEAVEAMKEIKARFAQAPADLADRMTEQARRLAANGTRRARVDVDVDETWGLLAFQAALEVKQRLAGQLDLRVFAFPQDGLSPRVADMLSEATAAGADGVGAHTDVDADPVAHIGMAAAIARSAGLPLEVHVDESLDVEHLRLPIVLEQAEGIDDLTMVHCLTLARLPEAERERWIAAIADRGAKVVLAPSILSFGLPLAPASELLEAGVRTLIGSDNLQDVFVPIGTGRMIDNLRMVAISCGVTSPGRLSELFAGVTDRAFDAVGGEGEGWEVGSPASFTVFETDQITALVNGDERVSFALDEGRPRKETV